MTPVLIYIAGLATLPALMLAWWAVSEIHHQFTSTSKGWSCYLCDASWGFQGDGSVIAVARARKWWHVTTAHPGQRGRLVMLDWRGWKRSDWIKAKRLMRAYPNPPVTVIDVLARTPLLRHAVYAIARRHGKKAR